MNAAATTSFARRISAFMVSYAGLGLVNAFSSEAVQESVMRGCVEMKSDAWDSLREESSESIWTVLLLKSASSGLGWMVACGGGD